MVNTTELRKRNKVLSLFDSIATVIEIYETNVLIQFGPNNKRQVYAGEDLQPIPLTPEILEKCGFEWDIYWQGRTDGNWVITEGEAETWRIAYGKRKNDIVVYGIKYLHKFQNLYFELTGKELTVNLSEQAASNA